MENASHGAIVEILWSRRFSSGSSKAKRSEFDPEIHMLTKTAIPVTQVCLDHCTKCVHVVGYCGASCPAKDCYRSS
jgi:hypothetical protein